MGFCHCFAGRRVLFFTLRFWEVILKGIHGKELPFLEKKKKGRQVGTWRSRKNDSGFCIQIAAKKRIIGREHPEKVNLKDFYGFLSGPFQIKLDRGLISRAIPRLSIIKWSVLRSNEYFSI